MLKLYNTLSQQVEPFKPVRSAVTVYVCGITPYDTTHLGHAFTYATADILIRYLETQGYEVNYVQNVTDIDDDILRKAKEVDEDWQVLGNRWTAHFIQDLQALNVRPPDDFPRATDVIPDIISIVQKLVAAGVAYEAGGNVYFEIDAWPEYGKLCKMSRQEMLPIANERGNNPDDPHKRDPLDFVLWQEQSPGEPAWDSPWGPGRPGWHIECSTMATRLLGETIDIHMGGTDLVFPHHESEIAQVEPITGHKPFVRFWLHTAMVHYEEEKMSKSLGNLIMVRDLLETWSPDAVRLYLANHHYRQTWSYDPVKLKEAARMAQKLHQALTAPNGDQQFLDPGLAHDLFTRAMNDDLDTPAALVVMNSLADDILSASQAGQHVKEAQVALRAMSRIFGLRLDDEKVEQLVAVGWDRHLQHFLESVDYAR